MPDCARCHADVDARLWVDGDHPVVITGPLAITRVLSDPSGSDVNTIRSRAKLPYLIVMCSEYDKTVAALDLQIERRTS